MSMIRWEVGMARILRAPRPRIRARQPSPGGRTTRTIELHVDTSGRRGLWDLTAACERFAAESSGGGDGLLVVFVPHATAGVVVMELGAGSDVDLVAALDRLLPRDERGHRHRHGSPGHGADHVLPLLAPPSVTVPVVGGGLTLGTWQSIALLDPNPDNDRRIVRFSFLGDSAAGSTAEPPQRTGT
jgi:secondary thiamine-phosphate synthase enzyme